MNVVFKLSFFILFNIFFVYQVKGQDTARIHVRADIRKDQVFLRWGATTPMSWKQTNKYGFLIERYTITREGELLPQSEKYIVNTVPLKAKPLKEWETIVQTNDYAAIIAQALYGDEFELSGGEEGIGKIITLSQELEQRFSLSLYAADHDFNAACMAGWGFKDTTAKSNENYLYRIIPALPDDKVMKIEMGAVYVAMDEYEELPKPISLSAIFGNKSVMLAWEYGMLSTVYNSYFIEKSTDGKSFDRLPGKPVTNLNNNDEQDSQRMFYIDSVDNNTKEYYYRIVGITAFGEIGPPSEPVSGKGKEMLSFVPHIIKAIVSDDGELELDWEFDERGNKLIKSFELNISDNPYDGFKAIVKNISPIKRSLIYDKLQASNYFSISAIPYDGEPKTSFAVLVQPLDTIPPAIPKGLKCTIDSLGIVTLTWQPNNELDLLGYKVYKALVKDEEFMPLFDIALQDTVYIDTVNVKDLNRVVYYTVSSLDMRYNQSDLSPSIALEKPDINPPSSPVLYDYEIKDEGIYLKWINSSDVDVVEHRIYRQQKDDDSNYYPLMLLNSIKNTTIQSYIDTTVTANIRYTYTITALKKNLLESQPSNTMTLYTNKQKQKALNYFNATVDKSNRMLKLNWSNNLENIHYYELYKAENNENMHLWKTIAGDLYEAVDSELFINTIYKYIIRPMLYNGKSMPVKELKIKY